MGTETKLLYPKSYALNINIYRKRYETTNNPLHLMQAFILACEYKRKIPKWVSDKLYDVFMEWKKTGKSLDILLGTKKSGPGGTPAYKEKELYERDLRIMEAMNIFMKYRKMRAADAAQKAVDSFRFLSPPSAEQVLKLYYRDHWNYKLARVLYPDNMVESILCGDENAIKEAFSI